MTAEGNKIACTACGFVHQADRYGLLHQAGSVGQELRYISDWSRMIYRDMQQKLENGHLEPLVSAVEIRMIDMKKKKFQPVGRGELSLSMESFRLCGNVHGEELDIQVAAGTFPSLPFSPGKYLEFQYGDNIYRCLPDEGAVVMKYINMIKVLYEKVWHGDGVTARAR